MRPPGLALVRPPRFQQQSPRVLEQAEGCCVGVPLENFVSDENARCRSSSKLSLEARILTRVALTTLMSANAVHLQAQHIEVGLHYRPRDLRSPARTDVVPAEPQRRETAGAR
jgi:hypothetical protein